MARRPQRSTGRALIGSGVGLIVIAIMLWLVLPESDPSTRPVRWLGSRAYAVAGAPLGIGFVVAGILRIRRGER